MSTSGFVCRLCTQSGSTDRERHGKAVNMYDPLGTVFIMGSDISYKAPYLLQQDSIHNGV
jgi:hypothetical protein